MAGNLASLRQSYATHQWPIFHELHQNAGDYEITLDLPSSIHWFEGHFSEQAVLPGVAQLHWAAQLGQYLFAIRGYFSHIDNLKFQQVILPNMRVTLRLTYSPEKRAIAFSYWHSESRCSEGKIVFAGPTHD